MEQSTGQLKEVAQRIHEMREIFGYSTSKMAELTEVDEETYREYESGTVDLPFTFLHKSALALNIELTELLEGRAANLSGYTVTRKGMGVTTASEDGILIQNLAPLFRQKLATPYWVTYQYSEKLQHEPIHTTTHDGQEFDLVLKGSLKIRVGDNEEILNEGDSIYYKSSTPHGMIALNNEDCTFLAMIMAGSEEEQNAVSRHLLTEAQEENVFIRRTSVPLIADKFVKPVEDENGILKTISFDHAEEFNFAFDIVDEIARKDPSKLAMIHVSNDMEERRFTFKDIKDASSQTANYFTSLGIKRGDRVMLVLKRHYQFWFSILALH